MIGNVLKTVKWLTPKVDYMSKPTLVSIGFSHFCERSRWMLDLSPLQYQEEMHAPAMHLSSTLLTLSTYPRYQAHSRTSLSSSGSTSVQSLLADDSKLIRRKEKTGVPKLVITSSHFSQSIPNLTQAIHVVQDGSIGIAHFLQQLYGEEMQYLYPPHLTEEVVHMENFIMKELAPAVTTFLFGCMLLPKIHNIDNSKSIQFFIQQCVQSDIPVVEKLILYSLGKSFIAPTMVKNNGIYEESRVKAKAKIIEVFQQLDERRAKRGHSFLFDTQRPTAADITLAAMSFPVMLPTQTTKFFASLANIEQLNSVGSQEFLELHRYLKDNSATAMHILDVYQHFRPAPK